MAFAGLAIIEGVMLVFPFLFFHEPVYNRFHVDPLAHLPETIVLEKMTDLTNQHKETTGSENVDVEAMERVNTTAVKPKKTLGQKLGLYSGRYSHNNIFLLLYRAFILTFPSYCSLDFNSRSPPLLARRYLIHYRCVHDSPADMYIAVYCRLVRNDCGPRHRSGFRLLGSKVDDSSK